MYACMQCIQCIQCIQCMHVCIYACMQVCMYACMHVCMYAWYTQFWFIVHIDANYLKPVFWSTGSTGVISKIDYTKQCDFQNSRVIHVGWWTFVLFKNGPMMKLGLEKRRMMAHTFPKTLWCRTVLVAPYNINVQITDATISCCLNQTQNALFGDQSVQPNMNTFST